MKQEDLDMAMAVNDLPDLASESEEERCGLIVDLDGEGPTLLSVRNVWQGDKRHGFEMDPKEQAEIYAAHPVLGMWHTHPTGPEEPSSHDLKFKPPGLRCFVATPTSIVEYTDMEYASEESA